MRVYVCRRAWPITVETEVQEKEGGAKSAQAGLLMPKVLTSLSDRGRCNRNNNNNSNNNITRLPKNGYRDAFPPICRSIIITRRDEESATLFRTGASSLAWKIQDLPISLVNLQ